MVKVERKALPCVYILADGKLAVQRAEERQRTVNASDVCGAEAGVSATILATVTGILYAAGQ